MYERYYLMLRALLFILFFSGCSAQVKTFKYVNYDKNVMPSCAIKITDKYWSWRDAQGKSKEIKDDLLHLYNFYLESVNYNNVSTKLSNDKIWCDSFILMSPELARIMNNYGKNTSPISFYYALISKISNSIFNEKILTEQEMKSLVVASIQDVENKFLDSQTTN